ncbi:unnamed protein product [Phaedon cochleariae]|uniref:THAP-type domain-containing protein n=1 Tax=Phaedon cochleariae TaxID=80249 RepID=A0A9P0GSS1_PHACE|nr:unnamed protein product [Phaedon cochleariae]
MSRKGGTVCVVRGCSSRTGGDTSLFSFPKDPVRAECWLRKCNREDLLDKSVDALHRNFKVCEKHFENKYITQAGGTRKHLFQQAVPTIFPHGSKHSLELEVDNSEERPKKVTLISGE